MSKLKLPIGGEWEGVLRRERFGDRQPREEGEKEGREDGEKRDRGNKGSKKATIQICK